jgi:hypothetical protein
MSTDPIVRANPVKATYTPFDRSDISEDWSGFTDYYGVPEAINLVKDRMYVAWQFDGAVIPAVPGHRAAGYGVGDDPEFRWLTFITGISGGCTSSGNYLTPTGVSVDWGYRIAAVLSGITPGSPAFDFKVTTTASVDANYTEPELELVIGGATGLSAAHIGYRHYLYASNLEWEQWTGTTLANYNLDVYRTKIQNSINSLWSPTSPVGGTYQFFFGQQPRYLVMKHRSS